jgi:alginate O-acetyltransferase complex protein AlgI
MTLSSWLRDYVYLPLGGNRAGRLRVHVNLMAVMLLGGLWHGAAWTFVLWGAYHGAMLVFYKLSAPWWDAAPRVAQRFVTLSLVVMGWVVFRATSVAHAADVYVALFAPVRSAEFLPRVPLLAALLGLLLLAIVARPSSQRAFRSTRANAILAATLVTVSLFVVLGRTASPFLYYQF